MGKQPDPSPDVRVRLTMETLSSPLPHKWWENKNASLGLAFVLTSIIYMLNNFRFTDDPNKSESCDCPGDQPTGDGDDRRAHNGRDEGVCEE